MKTTRLLLAICIIASLGFAAGYGIAQRLLKQTRAEQERQRNAWQTERTDLEAALERARDSSHVVSTIPSPAKVVQVTNGISPSEILERLKTLRVNPDSPRNARAVIHHFECLIESGPAALPAIRQFLAQNLDIEYDSGNRRGFRDGKIPTEFAFPPSLRLGLLEAVKRIGGEGSEQALAEVLKNTGRGAEAAYVAYALQEVAPNKYRDVALGVAHDLLARPFNGDSTGLDKYDRDYLYGVLMFFKDGSYVATAQTQIIQPGGQIDQITVRYLQQVLGEQSIAIAAQAWQDARVPAEQKEPLARLALAYAGVNEQANQLYQTAINEPRLSADKRRNLIEDLNETGFADPQRLTAADLPLIQKRMAMIEQLSPGAMDRANAEAFKEAYKDLLNMQKSLLPTTTPAK